MNPEAVVLFAVAWSIFGVSLAAAVVAQRRRRSKSARKLSSPASPPRPKPAAPATLARRKRSPSDRLEAVGSAR